MHKDDIDRIIVDLEQQERYHVERMRSEGLGERYINGFETGMIVARSTVLQWHTNQMVRERNHKQGIV